jgi:DNA-binding LytR/AlgR family response regulator
MVEQKEKVQEAESSQPRLPELLSPVPAIVLQSDTSSASLTLSPDQIRYVESVANYVDVHWVDGAGDWHKTTLRNTLKNLEKAFAVYPQLFRCHRAFIVNLNTIDLVEGNAQGYRLTLTGTTQLIPVSRSYLAEFDTRVAGK